MERGKLMKKLLILDSKNYTDDMRAFEKYAVRTIIVKNGRIATQHGAAGDYKIVGGGIENGETYIDTIMREVREEAGLLVKQDSIVELGEIEEIRKDLYHEDEKFICHSYFYYCEVLPWIYRDTRFVEMLQNHQFDNVVSLKTENESRILVK